MSKKVNLSKRERLRLGLTITSAVIGIFGIGFFAFHSFISSLSSFAFSALAAFGLVAGVVCAGVAVGRAVSRTYGIKRGKKDSLKAIKDIQKALVSPEADADISRNALLKNVQKYIDANLRLCKHRGFYFTGNMKEMINSDEVDRSSYIAEADMLKLKIQLSQILGKKDFLSSKPAGQRKYNKLSNKIKSINARRGEIQQTQVQYEDSYFIPELGIAVGGINKIVCNNDETKEKFISIAQSSKKDDFGAIIKVEYNQNNLTPTCVHFSDGSKIGSVRNIIVDELELLVQKHGESCVFPIEITEETDLSKTKRLLSSHNIKTTVYKSLKEYKDAIYGRYI